MNRKLFSFKSCLVQINVFYLLNIRTRLRSEYLSYFKLEFSNESNKYSHFT